MIDARDVWLAVYLAALGWDDYSPSDADQTALQAVIHFHKLEEIEHNRIKAQGSQLLKK